MPSLKCPRCGKKTPKEKQFCQHCLFNIGKYESRWPTISNIGILNEQKRQWQRDKHAKDIIQPYMKNKPNPDFVKAYKDQPELLNQYFTKDELRKNE